MMEKEGLQKSFGRRTSLVGASLRLCSIQIGSQMERCESSPRGVWVTKLLGHGGGALRGDGILLGGDTEYGPGPRIT